MKKRLTTCIFGAALVTATVVPVYAESQNMQISASVISTYTLTIPERTDIAFNAASTDLDGFLKVSGNVLPTESISVRAVCKALHNEVQGTDLPYKLMNGSQEYSSVTWNETELRQGLGSADNGKKIKLSVAITSDAWNQAKSGTYKGEIVFEASLS